MGEQVRGGKRERGVCNCQKLLKTCNRRADDSMAVADGFNLSRELNRDGR